MPEPIVPKDETEGEQDNNENVDAFGMSTKPEIPPAQVEVKVGEDGKPIEPKKEEKKFDTIPEDHPIVVALKQQIEDIKREYGGNLSGQREKIAKLEKQISDRIDGKGKTEEGDVSHLPFDPKKIVFSKDLPKDKLDDMTDNEIKLHDELMTNREVMNKQAQERFEEKQRVESEKQENEERKVEDLNTSVRTYAKELAGGDEATANLIIEKSKKFNLTGLNEKELKETIEEAYKLLPTYKPPKEQTIQKKGGAVKTGGESAEDPFGTSKIVEEVASKQSGKSFDL